MLSDKQIERYSRQIILPQVGGKGQEQLLRARVLVSVQGLLHVAALQYLTAAGIGTLGVFSHARDALLASLTFSQEQDFFPSLTQLNPDCSIVVHSAADVLSSHEFVQGYDFVISDSDALHDACVLARRPFLYASLAQEEGWLMVCRGYESESPCLRCSSFPAVANGSYFSFTDVAALFFGSHIATETIKHLLHVPYRQGTQRLRFHFSTLQCFEELVKKSPTCPVCSLLPAEIS
jgi:adenylyltransferase/sulfurtransferase